MSPSRIFTSTVRPATAIFIVSSPTIVGSRNVTATTPGGTSNAIQFNIVPPNPTLTAITPNSGNPGSAVKVTLTGTNFVSGMTVSAGPQISVGNVSVLSSTSSTVTFTVDSKATSGLRSVTATTSGGLRTDSESHGPVSVCVFTLTSISSQVRDSRI